MHTYTYTYVSIYIHRERERKITLNYCVRLEAPMFMLTHIVGLTLIFVQDERACENVAAAYFDSELLRLFVSTSRQDKTIKRVFVCIAEFSTVK